MQTLRIQLKEDQRDRVELRYWVESQTPSEAQFLNSSQIADLVKEQKSHYYLAQHPQLREMGQKLFCWLDGEGRWLSRAIEDCHQGGLILAIATHQNLAHLPWELLHDGTSFLVEGANPVVVPVRWIERKTPPPPALEARPLQVLFMATSPETVEPVLDFEEEEARILAQTQEMAVQVRVEESGCVAELGKLWKRYLQRFDIFHLTGHGDIQRQEPYYPYFITETETGDRHDAFAPEFAEVFRHRWPQLIFLSGCRTGQAGNQGTVLSMAETLIQEGARAVLGWGLPVLPTTATVAAAHLYQELAAGCSLGEGLGSTYRYLLQKEKVKDWHLLRLYVRGDCPGALVEPPGDYHWQPPQPPQEQFLDPLTHEVRVATSEEFVGRRRYLQRYLRALKKPQSIGVLIYGIGGVGKSTVAARLLERMPEYERIVIYRGLDKEKLINKLSPQTNETELEILEGNLSLKQHLINCLQILNSQKQQLIFVLDDFEANLEPTAHGKPVLKKDAVKVLRDLLEAIAQSRGPHRVIITCRYDFIFPDPTLNRRLYREPLAALRGEDLRKKCQRLESFKVDSGVDAGLQERAKKVADGNPRLLEELNKILQTSGLTIGEITTQMQKAEEQFRVDILAEKLLNQQDKDLREILRLGLVFEMPVPRSAFEELCSQIRNRDTHISRAISLGLLETIQSTPVDGELLRVSRLLGLTAPENHESLYNQGANILYRMWVEEWTKK
ncbi:CHAT domain-containing protein [Laspinema palackyanum]|uniref:CHAT domain-containing protein n=1 Tax=Laspinema palackyanum TaxID=3231601 RepID=UPI00345DC1C9|nr:CHAT domain-containing protein [Laspinema sp. D2c]